MAIKIIWIWTSLGNKKISEEEICEKANREAWFLKAKTELTQVFYIDKNQGTIIDIFKDAILNALINAKLTVNDIDWIFVSNSSSHWDKVISLSSILATNLWLNKHKNIIAKDINKACAWFGDALDGAFKQLKDDGIRKNKNYIVIAWDDLWSKQRNSQDIKTWMFSDWAWCVIISNNPNYTSDMEIKKTASWLSKNINSDNLFSISQPENEKLCMSNGKELSKSLLNTADEIFSMLNIKKLQNWTLIIPHQPNNNLLKKWEDNSEIISNAKHKNIDLKIHNETYKTIWNTSGSSVLFWLQKALKEDLLPKECKQIILTPFWAGWHIAWTQIKYKKHIKNNRLEIYLKKIDDQNNILFWKDAPISYRKSIKWRLTVDTSSKYWLSWFLPENIEINELIASIDIFHRQTLKNTIKDKEFVTKSIYYELPKTLEQWETTIFKKNNNKISWKIEINDITKIWNTKSWKDIYEIITIKDWIKIISEFVAVPEVDSNNIIFNNTIQEKQKWNFRKIESDDINMHWSIWWYISSAILLENNIPESALIEFIWSATYWEHITIKNLNEVDGHIRIPSKYKKENKTKNIKCIINEDTKSLVCILTPNIKLHWDIDMQGKKHYYVGLPL